MSPGSAGPIVKPSSTAPGLAKKWGARLAARTYLFVGPARIGIDAAAEAGIIVGVALDRVVAFDQVGILRSGAAEQALALADAGIFLDIVGKLGRLLVRRGVLVRHRTVPFARTTHGGRLRSA